MTYLYLAIAIIAEVAATSALKASEEFTRLIPSLIVIVGYGIAFYFMTLVLRVIPIGITYAIWSAGCNRYVFNYFRRCCHTRFFEDN